VVGPAESRLFIAPDGQVYRVFRAPRERSTEVSEVQATLVFETEDGDWIGVVPVSADMTIEILDVEDLLLLLQWARTWG
jgi:hypothetical protein